MLAWVLLIRDVWAGCPAELTEAMLKGAPVSLETDLAANSARPGKLIGASCTYTTSAVAHRVVEEGAPWRYTGKLTFVASPSGSQVACPYVTGDGGFHLVATELLDSLVACGYENSSLALEGRALEVDGVRYVVLTSFQVAP